MSQLVGTRRPTNTRDVEKAVLRILSGEGESRVKHIYLKLKEEGFNLSYDAAKKLLHRMRKRGLVISFKRGYYMVVPHLSRKGGAGGGAAGDRRFLIRLPESSGYRLQNIQLCVRKPPLVDFDWMDVYAGAKIKATGSCIYISTGEGLTYEQFWAVIGFLDCKLRQYKLSVNDFDVKRFEILRDFKLGREAYTIPMVFEEFVRNVVSRIYVRRDRVRVEYAWFEKDAKNISMKELGALLDARLSGSLATYELKREIDDLESFVVKASEERRNELKLLNRALRKVEEIRRELEEIKRTLSQLPELLLTKHHL